MNAPQLASTDWTTGNQQVLVAEFGRLKARLRGQDEGPARASVEAARAGMELPAAIDTLVSRFGLTPFERDLLLLAAGVEMDSDLAALCASRTESGNSPVPTFGLALAVLADPHWSALAPPRPLRYWRMLEKSGEGTITSCRWQLDERILHFLLGIDYLDWRLQPLLKQLFEPKAMAQTQRTIAEEVALLVEGCQVGVPVVQLFGNDGDGKRDIAAYAASRLRLQLYSLAGEDVPAAPAELELLRLLWQREAALLGAALFIDCGEAMPAPHVRRLAAGGRGVILLAIPEPVVLDRAEKRFRVDLPPACDQFRLWQECFGCREGGDHPDLRQMATELRLSCRAIARVVEDFSPVSGKVPAVASTLRQACLRMQENRFDSLAQRLETLARWPDLVLPEMQKAILRQIVVQMRQRIRVYEEWGFAAKTVRGLGISALFAGESGTGKTMAAEVLAGELDLDLYRVDLSAVVSKYIGETEKNLRRVFDAAESGGVILLFDEADALFGKRSEVRDSHDRYANIEVSYLLQRMEAYRGLAILTTNQKTALDTAFHRRLRFVVNFPFPEASEREAIWRSVFPAATPCEGLDYGKLARLQASGGTIRNIALGAAFFAADERQPVAMRHLLRATQVEAGKRERPFGEAETRGWL
jgi:predicted nucleic acid-binding protein